MKIGILGTGIVGRTLAEGFVQLGHKVIIGSREVKPELEDFTRKLGHLAKAATFVAAATEAEIIVLAVAGKAVTHVIELIGAPAFERKLIIDVTNPLDFESGHMKLFVGTTDSLAERIQRQLPNAHVVKALNIVPPNVMINPVIDGKTPDMIIAGNERSAKVTVTNFLHGFGWKRVIDIGDLEGARYLEALVGLWVKISSSLNSSTHAFTILP
jgi:predicted dinucleotide-binding enzyme